ncbi:MAG: efflux RND transporter permease subunit [Candidatus Methanofishera endochildressiae]|uniref:Efflux RND transporter permease subunit n=1 Tax=Candidatus Methanofishera endochildressiae TaxID=2738884 RepID=A0A7Z0SCD5_9GAMM|nr:efflux RND transporter permease subunit [Candidatus Methanofishera endochildressiae]
MIFFIKRPIFASAIALMMILAGLISMFVLPIAQYPPLVPSQIQVSTQYFWGPKLGPVVPKTVTTPLEKNS